MSRAIACVILLLVSSACVQKMADQPRYDPYDESTFFPDRLSARPLPEGVVPRNLPEKSEHLDFGQIDGKPAGRFPFSLTQEVLQRGRERYNVYCTPCHGYLGDGDGMIARRGLRRLPASFHTERLRQAPPGHFFDVITNGLGAMPPYAYQVGVRDRWSIVAYIRALQLSQWAPLEAVPPDERNRLESQR